MQDFNTVSIEKEQFTFGSYWFFNNQSFRFIMLKNNDSYFLDIDNQELIMLDTAELNIFVAAQKAKDNPKT